MNVYDFDKTIYDGDSTVDFYLHCIKKHPDIILCLPRQLIGVIKFKLKIIEKTQFKEEFYCFFSKIEDIDADLRVFWDKNQYKIRNWYKEQQQLDDLVISASPEFILREICDRIGINNLIASKVDKKSGKYVGLNCYGAEKLRRYRLEYDEVLIDKFYSDSRSDSSLAEYAREAFLVKENKIKKWEKR